MNSKPRRCWLKNVKAFKIFRSVKDARSWFESLTTNGFALTGHPEPAKGSSNLDVNQLLQDTKN